MNEREWVPSGEYAVPGWVVDEARQQQESMPKFIDWSEPMREPRFKWRTIARGREGVRNAKGEVVASITLGQGTVDYNGRSFVTKAAAVSAAEEDLDAMVREGMEI